MEPQIKPKPTSLYDADYQLWLEYTVAQLKARDFSNLDLENLIEEIEGLGRSDKRAVSSYLLRLCEHPRTSHRRRLASLAARIVRSTHFSEHLVTAHNVGAPLADHLQQLSHAVTVAARDPDSKSVQAALERNGNLAVKSPIAAVQSEEYFIDPAWSRPSPLLDRVATIAILWRRDELACQRGLTQET